MDMANNLRAVLLVSGDGVERETATAMCVQHCHDNGYRVTSIVYDRDEQSQAWRSAFAAVAANIADVLVVSGLAFPRVQRAGQPVRRPNGPPASADRRPRRLT